MNAYATRARVVLLAALAVAAAAAPALAAEPAGEVTVSFHVTLAPAWFDPSTAPPQITPFGVMYAIHDALVRPLPNQKMGASLAESWTESRDGLVYEFKLKRGLKFHNGDPITAEDVKFSFDRYNGAGARELRARVRQLDAVDPLTVRFTLKEPWPDFMTFYGTTATAAGIVLPKKYFESVGPDGFKAKPIGAGPYQFVSQLPARRRVRAARDGLRAAGAAAPVRPAEGAAAARGGRLSQRLRCRRVHADPRLLDGGRSRPQQPERRRHPRADAADGARGLLRRLAGKEAAGAVPHGRRQLRQRRQPRRGLHVQQGPLRVRRLSRHRRDVPAAVARARSRQARGDLEEHPAAQHRPRHVRAHHGPPRPDRHRPARGRAHHERDPDVLVPLVRGYAAEEPVSQALRVIPSSGEAIPALGLGTWQAFDVGDPARRGPLRDVLRRFVDLGGRVVDSSPMYGAAEGAVGDLAAALGVRDSLWVATKVWTTGAAAGVAQMERSLELLRGKGLDLMQVHNLVDWQTHLATLREWKATGRIRYLGVTHYSAAGHDPPERVMRSVPLDFVQLNYSLAEREAERRLLPLARERGIAVLVNRPLAQGALFAQARGRRLPSWAADFDCASWAQLFLKWILAHPAVTCVIPATRRLPHLEDNMQAGVGRLPDAATRERITALF